MGITLQIPAYFYLHGNRTVLRELLQNAADASASKITIRFETIPSSTVPLPSNVTPAALAKHTILNHTLKRLVVTNDGQPFGPNDWARLKRIAEGNPDETKIGAFGVGFYSVFSDCEEPFVSSGKEAMAFYWKGNSLFTRKIQLPESQSTRETTFVLDYRNTTTTIPSLLPLSQFLASSLTFVGLSSIELWLDDWKLVAFNKLTAPGSDVSIPRSLERKTAEGLVKIQSVVLETAQLDATWLNVIGWKPVSAAAATSASGSRGTAPTGSLRTFWSKFASSSSNAAAERAAREEREAQEAISENLMAENRATVFFHVRTANLTTTVSQNFAIELERATKKPPPKSTRLAVLTTSHAGNEACQSQNLPSTRSIDVFASVLPSKTGRIFIGFPTHQTTGLAAHISAPSVIPTVERESIDLNARYVRSWNQEMLRAAGIVCRIAWSEELEMMKMELSRVMQGEKRSKVSQADIKKVIPSAVHVLNSFTYKESTPSSQVGTLLEEAFWTCNKTTSIEILSSRGVLPSQHVRLAADGLSFVEGIPVVPPALLDQAPGFVKKLVDNGIIVDVTTADIKSELENRALNAKQLSEFLKWLVNKLRDENIDSTIARSLLSVTVANDDQDGNNKLIQLGQVKYYINPSKISLSLPVPSTTIPFKFIQPFDGKHLGMLGWEDLHIVPWVRFLLDRQTLKGEEQSMEHNPALAGQVLLVISKQWNGLSQSSKATIVDLLSSRAVIPTKLGLRKAADAYFPSVKLFEDLPVVTVNIAVKEGFLTALGVRKTIELTLVFERLLNVKQSDKSTPAWSHVELIKYLASVRDDIPKDDIKKLQDTPICSAENDSTGQRYKVTELFEPKDELRPLGVRLLQWPGIYRSRSAEGIFLSSLGLRNYPSASELILIISNAGKSGNMQLRDRALRYLVDSHYQHSYSASEIGSSTVSFLPLEGKTKETASPSNCFTNEGAILLGYDILKRDLHSHASKLGVQANPPINDCLNWLVRNPPESQRSARQLFGYFASRLNELSEPLVVLLSKSSIVPVITKSSLLSEKSSSSLKYLPPTLCFLGSGCRYADVFDYVDFGEAPNAFLIRCGSKPEPSTYELARLVAHEPARVFTTFNNTEKYLGLLTTLAQAWPSLKKQKDLVRHMKESPFLLASTEYQSSSKPPRNSVAEELDFDDDDEQSTTKSWQLSHANKITVVDDVINYGLFKSNVLAAPQEEELESFYLALGAIPLSSIVVEQEKIGPPNRDQTSADRLKRLVNERIKLFYHDIAKDQVKRDAAWVEKNLQFVAVSSLQLHKSLKTQAARHTLETSAIVGTHPQFGLTIFFKPGIPDLFNVSQSLLSVALHRPKPQQAIVLTTLLETDLSKLRTRGYDVSRILRRRQAEARIEQEESRKRLEEERSRIQEAEAARQKQSQSLVEDPKHAAMPGVFPDSPEPDNRVGRLPSEPEKLQRQPRGFFENFIDRMQQPRGRPLEAPENPPQPVASASQTSLAKRPTTSAPTVPTPSSVGSPDNLQKNLLNAIKASRPHNSSTVVSAPVINSVLETQTFCDAKPGQNISAIGEAAMGTKLFLSNTLPNKQKFMAANTGGFNSFETVVLAVAQTMNVPRGSMHIFYDEASATIAFNSNGALFMNYRYFEGLHLPDVQQGKLADAVVYWFVVACHELAHNIVADHSAAHSYYT